MNQNEMKVKLAEQKEMIYHLRKMARRFEGIAQAYRMILAEDYIHSNPNSLGDWEASLDEADMSLQESLEIANASGNLSGYLKVLAEEDSQKSKNERLQEIDSLFDY